jgi:hypothetical protein
MNERQNFTKVDTPFSIFEELATRDLAGIRVDSTQLNYSADDI